MAPTFIELTPGSAKYNDVLQAFEGLWDPNGLTSHPNPPRVTHIYKLKYKWDGHIMTRFRHSKQNIGSEMRLWHGTHRSCEIGANGNTTLCHHSSCGICNILRNSFDVAKAKQTNMFGKGIYFSQASHKASQYSNKVKGRKAMLFCYVTAGNPLYLDSEARYLGPPGPPGHDSVYATPGPNLKYHEIVSYRNASMRPGYLVTHVSH